MPRWVLVLVAVVAALRLFIAAHVPLTEDEAYYWAWSRHLAYGYLDHPPMVAWFIAATAWLGHNPLAVRLPFIAAEALAALLVGATAIELSQDPRAGAAATLIVAFIPQLRFALGEAIPDGPYLLFWSLALFCAVRGQAIALGLALGGALLSRTFAWFLLLGVAIALFASPARRRALLIALAIAALVYAPFLWWNATHGWTTFLFMLRYRQHPHAFSLAEFTTNTALMRTALFVAGLWIVAYFTIIRPRYRILGWTALPFPTLLLVISPFTVVESYWLLGPFLSLCAGIGIAYARASLVWKRVLAVAWLAPVVYTLVTAAVAALPDYSQVFAYPKLARDMRALSTAHAATPLTDRYEIAAELLANGVTSLVVGVPQAAQWRQWYAPKTVPPRVLTVSFSPLSEDQNLAVTLRRAYRYVRPGPQLRYTFAHAAPRTFYTAWAEDPLPFARVVAAPRGIERRGAGRRGS